MTSMSIVCLHQPLCIVNNYTTITIRMSQHDVNLSAIVRVT